MAPALIEAAQGRFGRLIADKGYGSNAIRAANYMAGVLLAATITFWCD